MRKLRALLVTAMTVFLALTGVTVASSAQAYTCSGGKSVSYSADDGVASTSMTLYPKCSDNKSHFSGTIRDTKCDGRAARIVLVANWTYDQWSWDKLYEAPNGCNTSSSFSGSATPLTGSNWNVRVAIGACSWSCSDYSYRFITP
jgi:hypothetical protein